ncbi:MFS transporter [Chloroflexota bacterium]
MMIMLGGFYSFGIFFKPLLEKFGWTRAMTSGAFSLSLVILSLFAIVVGKLNDRFGPRIVVSISGLLLGAGYVLVSQVSAVWQLYLFYGVLIGLGMSASFVPMVSTVARWFVRRRGIMTGIATAGMGMGTLIMPPVANWLVSSYGWRFSYMVVGVIELVLIILMAQFLKRDPAQMGLRPYGAGNIRKRNSSPSIEFLLQRALHTRQLWILGIVMVCFTIGLGTVLVHIVPHAIGIGISAANAAIILAIIGGVSTVSRVMMGSACDRIGNKLSLIISFTLLLISFFALLTAKELYALYLFAALFASGYGGISSVISPTIAQLFGLGSHGAILGVIHTCGESGSAIGSVLTGYIYDVTGGYLTAFWVCIALVAFGLLLIIAMTPIRQKV